jgi:hypothetical protein
MFLHAVQSAGPLCRLGCHDVGCYARSIFPRAGFHAAGQRASTAVIGRPAECPPKEALMVPLLLWILGVPGLIIILLLLLGIVKI